MAREVFATCALAFVVCSLISLGKVSAYPQPQSAAFDSANTNYECNLVNEQYHGETLFAASALIQFNFFSRGVFTWRLPNAKSKQLVFNADDKQSMWQLVPVASRPNTFLIRNVEYGEYLHASKYHKSFLSRQRRLVYMWKSSSSASKYAEISSDESNMWTFKEPFGGVGDQSSSSEHLRVTLWNVKFNEALFATGLHGKKMFSRDVFTWHKAPDSKQFNWFVKCRDDRNPLLDQYFYNNNMSQQKTVKTVYIDRNRY